jgi:hypothetical protein
LKRDQNDIGTQKSRPQSTGVPTADVDHGVVELSCLQHDLCAKCLAVGVGGRGQGGELAIGAQGHCADAVGLLVAIDEPDSVAGKGEPEGELHGERRFTDAALGVSAGNDHCLEGRR